MSRMLFLSCRMLFPLQIQTIPIDEDRVGVFVPDAAAVKTAYQQGTISFPYWSQVWPAAKALAQFLHRNPACTGNKTILELGAGLGLPSLVAARNAKHVLCTDLAPEAVQAAAQSAAGLPNFTAAVMDWQHLPADLETEVLLLSDINYEQAAFETLQKLIADFLRKDTTLILSTPQRLVAKAFLFPLLKDCRHREEIPVWHEGKEVATTVVVLSQNPVLFLNAKPKRQGGESDQ